MKKYFFLLLLLIIFNSLVAQQETKMSPQLYFVGEYCGAIVNGDTILPAKYNSIDLEGDKYLIISLLDESFSIDDEGFPIKDKKDKTIKYGLTDMKGTILKKCIYDDIWLKGEEIKTFLDTTDYSMYKVFTSVERMPLFPGGEMEMMKYISDNMQYPVIDHESGIRTRVVARFFVDIDGSVKDVRLIRSMYPSVDRLFMRLIRNMPKWEPGLQNGLAVPVYFTLPLHIRLKH